MNRTTASQFKFSQLLAVLAFATVQLSCKPYGSSVEAKLFAGKEFAITVNNRSADALVVDDRLFALGIESPVKVEVAHVDGAVVPPCGHIDYIAIGSRLSVPPDEEAVLSVPLTVLTATRCLEPGNKYLFRALLVSGGKVVSHTDWLPFRAVPLD